MGAMAAAVALTLAEASQVLDPPVTEQQLRQIVTALRWQPDGWRRTGRAGHPFPVYDVAELLELHAALVPFLRQ
jgi:hypothetical protein